MKPSFAVLLLFAAPSIVPQLRAQQNPSRFELYGGYDYVRFNVDANVSGQPPSQR